jgi:hypothetical protein
MKKVIDLFRNDIAEAFRARIIAVETELGIYLFVIESTPNNMMVVLL